MCGKFTAMASWSDVVDFSDAFSSSRSGAAENDAEVGFRVMSQLNVIIWDAEQKKRRVVPMRWGFPRRGAWRSPDPIHARSETIDSKPTFADAFAKAQRGILVVKTFNEGKQIAAKVTEQHTITLGDEPAGAIAMLFNRFAIPELPAPLLACVMVTVPANELIRTLTTEFAESDRMPAFLAKDDWGTWLGENGSSPAEAKECLRTVEGINWRMSKEERAASKAKTRTKPTVRDPGGKMF
jgi:putative SOS response-associated peptidase YedK